MKSSSKSREMGLHGSLRQVFEVDSRVHDGVGIVIKNVGKISGSV